MKLDFLEGLGLMEYKIMKDGRVVLYYQQNTMLMMSKEHPIEVKTTYIYRYRPYKNTHIKNDLMFKVPYKNNAIHGFVETYDKPRLKSTLTQYVNGKAIIKR